MVLCENTVSDMTKMRDGGREPYAAEVVAGVAVGGLDAVAARDGAATAVTLDELVVVLSLGEIGGGDDAEGESDDGEDGGEGAHREVQ